MDAARNTIHVACQSDRRLLPDCAAMLHSLCDANRTEAFEIHFLHDGSLGAADLRGLQEICDTFGHRWSPIQVPAELMEGLPSSSHYGGYLLWFRLFLHQLLPEIPRILYLDADVIVLDHVRPLWETDLDGYCLAAVSDLVFEDNVSRVQQALQMPPDEYFNSGVLVLNLDELRRSGRGDAAIRTARTRPVGLRWPDQDILNMTLWPNRRLLHPRWNALYGLWLLPSRHLPWNQQSIEEARRAPAIVHFVGPHKPWHYRCVHPHRARFFDHVAATRWKDRPIEGRTVYQRAISALPVVWQLKLETVLWQWKFERPRFRPLAVAGRLFPPESSVGGGLRDVIRWFTRGRTVDVVESMVAALAYSHRQVAFVQVGSNDAVLHDPLRRFIFAGGWRGVMVEPVPYVFTRLHRNYGRRSTVALENAAIASTNGECEFYSIAESDEPLPLWYDQIGSLSLDSVLAHRGEIPDLEQRIVRLRVPCLTFESLCKKHGIGRLDLIHIDAEGHDHEVLHGIDFASHRPLLVLYEHKHLGAKDREACRTLLDAHEYDCMEVGADTICVRRDAIRRPWTRLSRAWRIASRMRDQA